MSSQLNYVISAILGAILEFYDFVLYGVFAGIIANTFFPAAAPATNLMTTFWILAIGYFMRPLGGILFGHWGDKYSRRKALTASLILMGITTTAIGLLPGYQTWGIAAAGILLLLRLLQGLTVGGEMPGAMVLLLERGEHSKRWPAVLSTFSLVGAMLGVLLAIAAANITTSLATPQALQSYAWRIPFLLGILLALVGGYLRLRFWQESPMVGVKFPLWTLLNNHWRQLIRACLFLSMAAVFTAFTTVFLVPYLTQYYQLPLAAAAHIELYLTLTTILFLLLGAYSVDYLRCYRSWLLYGCWGLAVVSVPLFLWMQHDIAALTMGLLIFTALASLVMGAEIVFLGSLFNKTVRYSAFGFSHGLVFSVITGTSPLMLNYAVRHFGLIAPAVIFAASAVLAALTVQVKLKPTI
ncbi:MAG: MFS transporter [Gammaproteobacteria bacterium]|nr:MFS transporter [Gammaproteobacteria bacterium]